MIPTAEEFWIENNAKGVWHSNILIEFAKLHVQAALVEASEDVDMNKEYYEPLQEGSNGGIDIETILNAYPLTNIK